MTERTGGSDVAITETIARADGSHHRLYGTKWFTSATTSEMALTLARPEGNPPGGAGLALFYVETRDANGRMNGIAVNRLKDKLGTRMVPTAELTLDGALATAVAGTRDGIRNITPMLAITRTWNAVAAISGMSRALALATDYARKRVQFGAPLSEKPLHVDTLAGLAAERQAAFRAHLPRDRAPRPRRERGARRRREGAPPPDHAARQAVHRQASGRDRERDARSVRRRGLRRGHRPSVPATRRSSPPDLGRDDQRALARRASRARPRRFDRDDREGGRESDAEPAVPRARSIDRARRRRRMPPAGSRSESSGAAEAPSNRARDASR